MRIAPTNTPFAQGDLWMRYVEALPTGVTAAQPESGNLIVGHSETGHHHVIDADCAVMYEHAKPLPDEVLECFVVIGKETELRHLRSFDTHEPYALPPGILQVRRQREYVPEGFRRAQD